MRTITSSAFFKTILAIFLLSATGCATVFTGTRQKVYIASSAPGARVQVNGIDKGAAPLKVKLKRGNTGQAVTVTATGYEPKTIVPETNFNAATLGNIVFLPMFAIDLITGAMWKYHPKRYMVELEKRR